MMTTEPIIESDMTFGPFPDCFYIEKSQTYEQIKSGKRRQDELGVKTVELILLRPDSTTNKTAIWMIEAKKTSPNPKTHGDLEKHMSKVKEVLNSNLEYSDAQIEDVCVKLTPHPFNIYVGGICNKFVDALTLFIAIYLDRHSNKHSELSDNFKRIDLANVRFVFVLVIKNSEEEWLIPIQEALNKALLPTIKTWNLLSPNTLVLNEDMARQKKLII